VFPSENFDLAPTGTHSLDEPVHFIGFATRFAHFRYDDVRIQATIDPRGELEVAIDVVVGFQTNKHVFFRMIEPVARSSCANDALKLGSRWFDMSSDGKKKTEKRRPDLFSPK
jgi:hypothetical protein